ncbi:MAG: hypothetical protein V4538_01640 [Bacteroidota bacterium]
MNTNLQLSKNLTLDSIQENNFKANYLIAVVCYFTFFGECATAYISIAKLDGPSPSYAMMEMDEGDLFESFTEKLEDEDIWQQIVTEVKKYKADWEAKQLSDQ